MNARFSRSSGDSDDGGRSIRDGGELSVGSVLNDHILPLEGMSQQKLADALGVSRLTVNELLNDKRSITAPMALRLARALSTSPEFWMDIQRDVDLAKARAELGSMSGVPVLRARADKKKVVAPFKELFGGSD